MVGDQVRLRRRRLAEIAGLFLKLGTTAFGGPAAHIALMEEEVVRRRGWVSREEFMDLVGAVNLIPGPNSTELAIHLGHRRGGWVGLVVAGVCFILPASLIVGTMASIYVEVGQLPEARWVLDGIKPVILAVVVQALWGLGRSTLKNSMLAGAAVVLAGLAFLGVHELALLVGSGIAALGQVAAKAKSQSQVMSAAPAGTSSLGPATAATATAAAAAAMAVPYSGGALFLFFLKVGSVLYGSGYVLLAFLRADLVERWHWLTEAQLLDAIAVGQFTPGPVFTTATFIGFILGGSSGAALATLGIFLPAFLFVAVSGPLIPKVRRSRWAGAFLDGVNVASLALMATVATQLAASALGSVTGALLFAVSLVCLIRWKINATWLIVGGGLVGYLMHLAG